MKIIIVFILLKINKHTKINIGEVYRKKKQKRKKKKYLRKKK